MPAKVKSLALAAALAAFVPGPAFAAETPASASVKEAAASEEVGPDDLALRYFAAHNQSERVEAEIARLQRLYPGYKPPTDLYTAPANGVVDETALWKLYSQDKLDELRTAVAAKQREIPGYRPSADLATKIHRKELRRRITAYWKDGRWQDLVDYVRSENVNMRDSDADLLWTIAEAFARTKQMNDALAIYKSVLTSASEKQIKIATLQKALGSLRLGDVETLLAGLPAQGEEMTAVALDVTRARIAAYLHDERAEDVSAAEMNAFEAYARGGKDPAQLGLVAWYDYKRRDFHGALEWFKLAIENGGDAMVAHGLAHTLRALQMPREAEEVAYAWREPLVNNAILFVDLLETDLTREIPPYVEPERLARYARVTMETASGEGAQALAWYSYNSCQFDAARSWFERAVAWFPKDATVYGYALTLRRVKKDKEFYELENRYDGLFPKLVEILFPDGRRHPPTPCDSREAAKFHGQAVNMGAYIVPGPANFAVQPNDPNALAPLTQQAAADDTTPAALAERALKNLKGKFPAAVDPENPLRVRALPMAGAPKGFAEGYPVASETAFPADPGRGVTPLVARRAPGVGPMPYERYGFNLLPGWNGIDKASWPTAAQQIAPAGTQWANQEADPAKAGGLVGVRQILPMRGAYGDVARPVAAPSAPRAYGQFVQPMGR